ncbi:hypothetical protein LZL87_006222 [Fusarium oxysporum]|nr:hypothetical protein LZL87_006222 [Fusarium oxysporum]
MAPPVRDTRLVPGKKSFLDLTPELQAMIINFLISDIPPLTIPCDAKAKYKPIISAGERNLLSLKLSCRMIYNAIKEKRTVEAFTIAQPQPSRNMLRVWDMKLPLVQGTLYGDLPVQRFLSVWLDKPLHQVNRPYDERYEPNYPGDSLQLWRQMFQGRTSPDQPRTVITPLPLSNQDMLLSDL